MSTGDEQTRTGGGGAESRSEEAAGSEIHFGDSHGERLVQADGQISVWTCLVGMGRRAEE